MDIMKLRIDGQMFYLPADLDLENLKAEILSAVTGAPAFITFRPTGYGEVTVLITPTISVRFEVEQHSAEEIEEWEDNPPDIDLYGSFS